MHRSYHSALNNSLTLHRPAARSSITPSQPWREALVCLGALVVFLPALQALDPAKTVFQFNCHNWTREAGLPADKISTVAQTLDGYIWLGSQNGLVRFDGLEFTVIPINLPQAQGQDIRQLDLAADGRLWFSVRQGGYGSFDGETFSAIGDPRWTAPGMYSNTIHADRNGAIWTGSSSGWGRWMPGKPDQTCFDVLLGNVMVFAEDPAGLIWMGTAERGLLYWAGGKFELFPDEELKKENIRAIATDAGGDLWVGTGRGLRRYDAQYRLKQIYFPNVETMALLIDRHGVLWAGTNELGLARYANDEFSFLRKADGLGSDSVTSLLEDREGSLWIGTVDGLSQLSDLKFPIYSTKEGLIKGDALAVAASPKGGLWISTSSGASYFDGKTFRNYSDDSLLPNHYVRRVFEAKNGDIYLADGDKNINVLSGDRLAVRYVNDSWPEAFAEDAEGLIGGIGPKLVRFRHGKIQPFAFRGAEPLLDWVNDICVAKDDALWVATNNGLFRIKDGNFEQWSTASGLSANRVHYVVEDADGVMWAGMPTGMARIKDHHIKNITMEAGLPDGRLYVIVPDDYGFFWVASGRGLFRVSRESLNAFADGKSARVQCESFDGLESVKFSDRTEQGFTGAKSLDGRIWFPNPRGVVMIDPAHYFTNKIAPQVHIEKVYADGRELKGKDSAVLAVGARRVEIFFSALSYVAPQKTYVRYRLDGFDHEWIEAGTHRSAVYSNLKPGRYTFTVQAANADGVWNTAGDNFNVELPAPFYARFWFYALCGVAVALALFGDYRWKVRHLNTLQMKLKRENDLLEIKVGQRTDELANSLSLLKATLDSTADGILAIQLSSQVISYNRQFVAMWRMPPELVGKTGYAELRAFTVTQVKDPAHYAAMIETIFASPEKEAFDVVELKDGRLFESYCKPQRVAGQNVGVVIDYRDITERKRAEAAIAEASAFLESLLTTTLDQMYFKDRDSRFVRYSEALVQRHGLRSREALRGKTDFDLLPEAQARTYAAEEQEIIRTGRPVIDRLDKNIGAHGESAWTMTTKTPWRDACGNIIGTFGITRDVTAVKEAEIRLAHERDLLRALLDGSPDQIYFKDLQSRFVKTSSAQAIHFGLRSPADLVGRTDFDFFTDEHARPAYEDEQAIIRTGRPLIGKVEKESWQDGRETWAITSKMPLRNEAGAIIGTIGISKDITQLKQAEAKLEIVNKQLLESSRQAGMAEVATGVLHNVGNVLNSVNVSATLVADQLRHTQAGNIAKLAALFAEHKADLVAFLTTNPRGQMIPAYLATLANELANEQTAIIAEVDDLRKNVAHIKDIVAMQQAHAGSSGVIETVAVPDLTEEALRINADALARHGIRTIRDYRARPTVTTDRHKVMQILINLLRNAKQACNESGRPDKQITVRLSCDDHVVKIAIIDNGVGIPEENLTRIFNHGFTTKKEGHGFGLHSGALAAKELGGVLHVESGGPGRGATFILELPAIPPPAPTIP
jgi:PAS domain S-box-containing protein